MTHLYTHLAYLSLTIPEKMGLEGMTSQEEVAHLTFIAHQKLIREKESWWSMESIHIRIEGSARKTEFPKSDQLAASEPWRGRLRGCFYKDRPIEKTTTFGVLQLYRGLIF